MHEAMKTDSTEKDEGIKKKSPQGLTGSLTENLWNKETPETELEKFNQDHYNQLTDQHVEATDKKNGEEKPPAEKKLRTILYSETKEINGKEEAVFDENFLKKIGEQSKKFDMLNGIDFTEYITTSKEDLARMQINPMTDLVYEITDEEAYGSDSQGKQAAGGSKLGETRENPDTHNGIKEKVVNGNINVGGHTKQRGVNDSNLHINLGRTLAYERLAHGYNNILNNLTGSNDLREHTKSNETSDMIHTSTDQYKKLRHQDKIADQSRTNIKSLHNFVNKSHKFFNSGNLEYKLDTYQYTKDDTRSKDRLFPSWWTNIYPMSKSLLNKTIVPFFFLFIASGCIKKVPKGIIIPNEQLFMEQVIRTRI